MKTEIKIKTNSDDLCFNCEKFKLIDVKHYNNPVPVVYIFGCNDLFPIAVDSEKYRNSIVDKEEAVIYVNMETTTYCSEYTEF